MTIAIASGLLAALGAIGSPSLATAQMPIGNIGQITPNAPNPASVKRGVVMVSASRPAQVTVTVDGRPAGALPLRLELEPGMHEISGSGPEVDVHPVRVRVDAGQTISIGLNVLPRMASFEVDPVAPDALLLVDQKPLGHGKRTVALTPGRHHLELRRPGYQPQRLELKVAPGQKAKLKAASYVPIGTARTASEPARPAPTPTPSPPTGDSSADPSASPYRGIFGSFIVPIMLGGDSTHSYLTDCPATAYGGACTASAPRGGGLALRLGYFYEWVGLELVGALAVDVTTTELKLPPIPTISSAMQDAAGRSVFIRAGGMYGIGARLAVPMQGLRITLGADYLFIHRKVYAIPDSFAGANLAYSTPGWLIDGGIQLGSTPGARFYLGAFALIEQAHDLPLNRDLTALGLDPSLVPEELTRMTVYRGRQVFYGPLLGIAFGH